eukprot:scaffold6931_cov443-Prasinococcus_capsulatus_cf.AAC.13
MMMMMMRAAGGWMQRTGSVGGTRPTARSSDCERQRRRRRRRRRRRSERKARVSGSAASGRRGGGRMRQGHHWHVGRRVDDASLRTRGIPVAAYCTCADAERQAPRVGVRRQGLRRLVWPSAPPIARSPSDMRRVPGAPSEPRAWSSYAPCSSRRWWAT